MTDDVLYPPAALDLLDRFLAEYRRADRPAQVLERYAARHPELADEFRLQAGFCFIDPADEPADLPDVTLLREIGRGGMGVVYEGWQESLARPVAVKLHRMTDAAAERDRFVHECRTLARLHQTSIVPVHTAGRAGPWLYYVMPLIEGATLGELVRRARARVAGPDPLPTLAGLVTEPPGGAADLPAGAVVAPGPGYVRSAAEVVLQAAEAVEYAHREGVWHLDLKPANLMLDAGGHGWIIDFGVAHQAGGPGPAPAAPAGDTAPAPAADAPAARAPFLTLAYAAPERWRGAADARSDVWGLGATLYELLTLRRPFPADDPATLAAAVAERDPTPAHLLAAGLSRDLSAVCDKALAKRADDRYPTAGALAADLRRWLGGHETSARAWSPVTRLAARARRHRPWAVAAGSAVVGVLVAFILLWQQERLKADEARARGQAAVAEERLLREADSHAKSKVWSLLELARRRAQSPRAGRRTEVRELLLAAARERRGLVPDDTAPVLDVALRSVFVETLGTLDVDAPAAADRAELPNYEFRDWPAAIHPGGELIALGTAGRPIAWRRGGPKPAPDPAAAKLPRNRVEYGPGGEYLAEILSDETGGGLRLWDREATRMLGELIPPKGPGSVVLAVGFDTTETRLWAAREDGRVSGWDLPGLAPVPDWPLAEKPQTPVTAAAFGPGARTVVLGDGAGRAVGYDAGGRVTLRRAARPARAVQALAWDPAGGRLAVGTGDGTMHMFDPTGALLFRGAVSPSGVSRIVFTPDGRFVAGWFRDGVSRFRDAATGRVALVGCPPPCGFARDGRTMAAATLTAVGFERLAYPEAVTRWEGHRAAVNHLRWAADGRRLASLDSDFEVRVWDVARPGSVADFAAPRTGGFWAYQGFVALSPDGRRVGYASGGLEAARAVVYDVDDRKPVAEWDLPGGFETLAAAGPDRFVLVREETRAADGNVRTVAYDLEPGKPLGPGRVVRESEPGDQRRFMDHWLLPDGTHYLWAGPREPAADRRIELYNVADGRLVWRIPAGTPPDGASPACLLAEDRRTLWVSGGGVPVRQYDRTTHDPPVTVGECPLSVSPDRQWMAFAGSLEGGGLASGSYLSLRRAPGDRRWVDFTWADLHRPGGGNYLFSPDGRYLAFGSMDGSITLVDLPLLADRVRRFEADAAGDGP